MTPAAPKVVIAGTADSGGGAERMSVVALDGLNELGYDAWLVVGDKRTDHPRVRTLHSSPFVDYRQYQTITARARAGVERFVCDIAGAEDFAHPFSRHLLEVTGPSPAAMLILDNLHGGWFDLRALPDLSARMPVIVRLCDSWLMTGHCATPGACDYWRTRCGSCPDLSAPPAIRRDLTRLNWRRKAGILGRSKIHVVGESEWILWRATESLVAPAIVSSHLIPAAVDVNVFQPGDMHAARSALGIEPDMLVLVTAVNGGTSNPHKDHATMLSAVGALREPRAPVELVVGGDGPDERLAEDVTLRRIPYLSDLRQLARWYQAADLYVHSAREETLGISAHEAMACGIPVVSASDGGLRRVLADHRVGVAVGPGDTAGLRAAVEDLLSDPAQRRALGAAARAYVVARCDRRRSTQRLADLCEELIDEAHRSPA